MALGFLYLTVELACLVFQVYSMSQVIEFLGLYVAGIKGGLTTAFLYAMGLSLAAFGFVFDLIIKYDEN